MHKIMDGERVHVLWYPLLKDIREIDGVDFRVNEGRRTRERQQELINQLGLYDRIRNPHGAAAVSGRAPHIRDSPWRPDHAIDFENASGVIAAARKRGVELVRTVSTEEWHVEIHSVEQIRQYNVRRSARIAFLKARAAKAKRAWKRARAAYRKRTGR